MGPSLVCAHRILGGVSVAVPIMVPGGDALPSHQATLTAVEAGSNLLFWASAMFLSFGKSKAVVRRASIEYAQVASVKAKGKVNAYD
ncbi:hypothetical protein TH25_19360 [Thalassospira profundimaris]|uniref:Uncharacterized protein n=1 Tax=Thalassospira profundimaris TaxID=502049 RepID=A0A367WSH8_9PROT|nr:hypothetical protein TH25_19360 [Thalassospira profundimaris]